MRRVKINGVYKHFKGDYYIVVDLAKYSEDMTELVIYRGLYGDAPLWARPLNDFLAEVNHQKYPNVKQKYSFQLMNIESVNKWIKVLIK